MNETTKYNKNDAYRTNKILKDMKRQKILQNYKKKKNKNKFYIWYRYKLDII